jgi:hypothetical protein
MSSHRYSDAEVEVIYRVIRERRDIKPASKRRDCVRV